MAKASRRARRPKPADSAPGRRPPPRTRIGRTWAGIIIFTLVLVVLLIFILQNTQSVEVSYFGAHVGCRHVVVRRGRCTARRDCRVAENVAAAPKRPQIMPGPALADPRQGRGTRRIRRRAGLPHWGNPFAQQVVDHSPAPPLLALQDLSQYHAATGTLEVVVDVEHDTAHMSPLISGERTTFLGRGSVDATVDFSNSVRTG